MNAHGDAAPLVGAEVSCKGREWHALLGELCLPVSSCEVQRAEDAVLRGEREQRVCARNGELGVLQDLVGAREICAKQIV